MGTLTARDVRLPTFCEHKLPTSCRLSSIPNCCACADDRAHSLTYSVYIDGIGYVPRGTRWQRYCWFCKEFWENRVKISGVPHTRTRIPEVPDQSEFLERWYQFHRGYRIVHKEDGTEDRVAVLGEDLASVSPGFLPRTLDELRAGRAQSQLDTDQYDVPGGAEPELQTGPSLDEALDQMLADATNDVEIAEVIEDDATHTTPGQRIGSEGVQQQMSTSHLPNLTLNHTQERQLRRVAALRRELDRMRRGIERVIIGLRDLGEDVPNEIATTSRLTDLIQALNGSQNVSRQQEQTQRADENTARSSLTTNAQHASRQMHEGVQARVDEARLQLDNARQARAQAANQLDLAERELTSAQHRLQQVQQEQRTVHNYTLLFGTREEMVAQGDDYVSPIGAMFSRAYDRFRHAEELRREERTLRQVLDDEAIVDRTQHLQRLSELQEQHSNLWRASQPSSNAHNGRRGAPSGDEAALQDNHVLHRQQEREGHTFRNGSEQPIVARQGSNDATTEPPRETLISLQFLTGDIEDEADLLLEYFHVDTSLDAASLACLKRIHDGRNSTERNDGSSSEENDIGLREEDIQMIEEMACTFSASFIMGLQAKRIQRKRELGRTVSFSRYYCEDNYRSSNPCVIHDLEIMGEAFRMSPELRRRAVEFARVNPEEVPGLSRRLWTNIRTQRDLNILATLYLHPETRNVAIHVHPQCVWRLEDAQPVERPMDIDEDTGERPENWILNGDVESDHGLLQMLAVTTTSQNRAGHNFSGMDTNDDDADSRDSESDDERQGLDVEGSSRPDPKSEEELTFRLDCRICYTQVADVACLPCGHLVMCEWCSEQHSPVTTSDRTRPRFAASCPVCRKAIRQKVRVFRA